MTGLARVRELCAQRPFLATAAVVVPLALLLALLTRGCAPTREETTRDATADARHVAAVLAQLEERRATVEHVERREETRPDGSRVVTSIRDRRTDRAATSRSATTEASAASATATERRVVERARPRLRAELRAGWHPRALAAELPAVPPVLGGTLSVRIAGPLSLGVWAHHDRLAPRELRTTAGLALALEW